MPTLRVGTTTQRFFEEGEQHEAAEWADTVLPPDDAPETDPDKRFDSFDKIPKKRSPAVTLAAIGACLLIGVAAWAMAFGVLRRGHSVQESTRALTGAPAPASTAGASANAPRTPDTESANTPANATSPPSAPGSPRVGGGQTAPGTSPPAGPLVVPMAPSSPTTPPTIAAPKSAGAVAASRASRTATSVIEITSVAAAEEVSAPQTSDVLAPGDVSGAPLVQAAAAIGSGTQGRSLTAQSERTTGATGAVGLMGAPHGTAPGGLAPGSSETAGVGSNVRPSRSPDGADRAPREPSSAPGRDDRVPPLRGYVWSPSAKSLVPADRSLPTTDPDFAQSTTTSSGVRPTAPAAPPTGMTSGTVDNHGAVVAPPTVGATPTERPAPVGRNAAQIEPPTFSPR